MPLLLLDLDDTLVDRADAYRRWAASFAARHGDEREADWLVEADDGGYAPREQLAGIPLEGAWVVGDCPDRDIAGAAACGLRSAWLHRGRTWDRAGFHPTAVAGSLSEAVEHLVERSHRGC